MPIFIGIIFFKLSNVQALHKERTWLHNNINPKAIRFTKSGDIFLCGKYSLNSYIFWVDCGFIIRFSLNLLHRLAYVVPM